MCLLMEDTPIPMVSFCQKKIKPESDQATGSNFQLIGNMEDRGTYEMNALQINKLQINYKGVKKKRWG